MEFHFGVLFICFVGIKNLFTISAKKFEEWQQQKSDSITHLK